MHFRTREIAKQSLKFAPIFYVETKFEICAIFYVETKFEIRANF
jgi:hypothetical protein